MGANNISGVENSKLSGIVQEAGLKLRVDWSTLSKRLSEFGLSQDEAFEHLVKKGIISLIPKSGYYHIINQYNKQISPENYCFTSRDYAEQYADAFHPNDKISFAMID